MYATNIYICILEGYNNLQWKPDHKKVVELIFVTTPVTEYRKMVKSSYRHNPMITYNNLTTLELFLALFSVSSRSSLPTQTKFLPGHLQPVWPIAASAPFAPAVLSLHQPEGSE